jgi:hypothetical protein
MSLMKWSALAGLSCALAFQLFGCRKKSTPAGAAAWLEAHFPGRFEVVETNHDLSLKNVVLKKYKTIVREKADPEVQFAFFWSKNEEGLGPSVPEIEKPAENSRTEIRLARELAALLKQVGFDKIAVGVREQDVIFTLFAEPAPDERQRSLQRFLTTLDTWQQKANFSYWLDFMEENTHGEAFGASIPEGHWHRQDSWHRENNIFSLKFAASQMADYPLLAKQWLVNTDSKRLFNYARAAYSQALTWAEKHRSKPFYLEPENMLEYQPDKNDGMAIRLGFPFFDKKPEEGGQQKGPVSGIFRVDDKSFRQIEFVPLEDN